MKKLKVILLSVSLLISAFAFSQASFKSNKQEKCTWNIKTKKFDNCKTQTLQFNITIDESKKRIHIQSGQINHIYLIRKVKSQGDYEVIEASGTPFEIKINKSTKQLSVLTANKETVMTYYLNK